jgi:hypothetical protein
MKTLPCCLLLLLPLLTACAQRPPASGPGAPTWESARGTHVQISYVLGHSQRKLVAEAGADSARAELYLEKALLEEGTVDRGRYAAYLASVTRFLGEGGRTPAEEGCRSRYQVLLREGARTRTLQGCRGPDDGISRLIREGELLLLRK